MQQIQFTGQNIEITEALRNFISGKFKKLKRYADTITSTHVILNVDRERQIAEARLHVPGAEIYAKADTDDMYKTIDSLVDKLSRQLKKHKEKSNEHR